MGSSSRLPDEDKRLVRATNAAKGSAVQMREVDALRSQLGDVQVDWDPITGSPKSVSGRGQFLTGPNGSGKSVSKNSLATVPASDPDRVAKAFLNEHRALFGHGAEAVEKAARKREFTTTHNGLRTVTWEQQVGGVPLFESVLTAHTSRQGELVSLSSQFVPDAEAAATRGLPNWRATLGSAGINARRAVKMALGALEEVVDETTITNLNAGIAKHVGGAATRDQSFGAAALKGPAHAKLIWLPMSKDELRLCWDVLLTARKGGEMFRVLVDAQSGEWLVRRCLTNYATDASYRVFTSDSPTPLSPSYPTPTNTQPAAVSRTLLTLQALNMQASPNGWINDGDNETLGNNVDAHTDTNDDDQPDLPRPHGTPDRVFDFPMNLNTDDPASYSDAAVVQLFYWCNFMHDRLYELGFTEAAGNFQTDNFGRGGLGDDAVQADAQDGGGLNNANFGTPPDGFPGQMQMYIFSGANPRRDGDLDAEIVLHEYTHGLSNRRVGGGIGLSALQSGGMGEGWSDFYALSLLSQAGDDPNGVYAAAAYASYQLGNLQQNYYFGIRRYPYSTDLSKNPLTFKDIDPAQASAHSGVPRSSIIGNGANEVHNQGQVWCMTLWEARANLIAKYGGAAGNQMMLQLVTDGMNLSPPNPNFLQARDAILQADFVNNGGANRNELWAAFAKRGMGFNAISPPSFTTAGLTESFDLPDDLRVLPLATFIISGPVGGPFNPNVINLRLTNGGNAGLDWSLANTVTWLTPSLAAGTLGAQQITNVAMTINPAAGLLPAGVYTGSVAVTNRSSLAVNVRQFILRVGQPDTLTEVFTANDNRLAFNTFTFTPDGSLSFYSVCKESATAFPSDPAGGNEVSLTDDSFAQVNLPGTDTVAIYEQRTNVFFIGSNGYLTFKAGDVEYAESLPSHFDRPRVSALFHDLDPGTNATVSWKQFSDHVAVTWENIPEYGVIPSNNFQVEMFFDGRIRVTYLDLNCLNNLVGLSAGHGTPAAFAQMDFANFGPCPTPPPANMDHFAFSHIPSPQAVNVPFTVQIEAQDGTNNPVADFHNAVTISGGLGFKPIKVSNFVQGVWSGTIVVTQASGTFVLQADDGYGHLGFSTPIAIGQSPQIQSEIDAGIMTLRWPAGAPGLILEKTPSLSAPTWTPAGAPVLLGDQYEFRINTAQPKEFFRLHSVGP